MYVAKTKALISFAVTAKLICGFVFAYAKRWFSHDAAHINFQMKNCDIFPYALFCIKHRSWVHVRTALSTKNACLRAKIRK